jgi:hypothetical protein
MKIQRFVYPVLIAITLCAAAVAHGGDMQRVLIQKEIDDDHVIVVTEQGEQLFLEKWSLRFSPLIFEGKTFLAEVSPMWVTIYVEGQDPIKWSVEKSLGYVAERPTGLEGVTPTPKSSTKPVEQDHGALSACIGRFPKATTADEAAAIIEACQRSIASSATEAPKAQEASRSPKGKGLSAGQGSARLHAALTRSSCESGHWINEVMGDGAVIKLEDGSIWKVDDVDQIDSALWLPTTEIVVCNGQLINTEDNESVHAERVR